MFGKRRKAGAPTVVGPGSAIEGNLQAQHGLHVDGRIEGDVQSEGDVSVGPDGSVQGTVQADRLSVAGVVEGTVWVGGCLHVLATGRVRGEAYYETLQVEAGGVVDGRTERFTAAASEGKSQAGDAEQAASPEGTASSADAPAADAPAADAATAGAKA
jgi:cytoskeletal protein CcmA (bactofilin family)